MATGKLPTPSKSGNRGGGTFAPFLKFSDIGRKAGAKGTVKIDGGKRADVIDGNYGDQLAIDAQVGAKRFTWGITLDSVNYRILFERFGANPAKWKGAVKVFLKENQNGGNPYIAVENPKR